MPLAFRGAWTADRRRIVDEILYRAKFGGKKALAAPRGKGKTSIAEGVVGVYAILSGLLKFPVIIGATGPAAQQILANIKDQFEDNDLLAEDFPEVCFPIRALEGWSSKARMQTVNGRKTKIVWTTDKVVFPRIEGSLCSGSILATRSIDGQVRGTKHGSRRPDFALVDDPETRASAKSETECNNRETAIDNDVGGLGGDGEEIATLILTTCQNCTSLSYRYTDPRQKPAYAGERMRAVDKFPDDVEKWKTYVEMRKEDMNEGDVEARRAHQFYIDDRQAMDAGAILADEEWYDRRTIPDGSQREVSAIQHIYNIVADKDWDYVLTELQNDPPTGEEESGPKLSQFMVRGSAQGYSGRINGQKKGILPPGAGKPVAFIDVGDNYLTWEVLCEVGGVNRPNVVDYGRTETDVKSLLGPKAAIRNALNDVRDYFKEQGYQLAVGLIDSGSGKHTETVYKWVKENGDPWYPSKGDGKYVPNKPAKNEEGKKNASRHWNFSDVKNCARKLVLMDANHWKHEAQGTFMMSPLDKNGEQTLGACRLFGFDPHVHAEFGRHIVAEEFVSEFTEKWGWRSEWLVRSKANHFLDTHYGCLCALAVAKHQLRPGSVIVGPRSGSGSFVRSAGGGWFRGK